MKHGSTRRHRGQTAFHSGAAAEDAVARVYFSNGHSLIAKRWRGKGGEIDLIFALGTSRVFVEVKKSKTFSAAALRVSQRQVRRLFTAAEEYLCDEPSGLLTDARFDVALVDDTGRIEVLENALVT